ncbi:hypothetical protein NFI96_013362 [Prochilodus magdalenae]|nr:hypothetical protein NFI96_013362 [Prochilodus magdalenae]
MLLWTKPVINMVLYLFFQITCILLFTSELSVNGCKIEIRQPQELIVTKDMSASILCNFSMSACQDSTHKILWYVFTSHSHHQLDTNKQPLKYRLDGHGLQISSLTTNDDGVYYCAVVLDGSAKDGTQAFGNGTTVMVREHVYRAGQAVLVALLVLLALFSLAILTLIICMKTGRRTWLLKGRFRRSDMKNDSSKRVLFGAVVQELYNKRNLRSNKKNPTEVSQENKFENPRTSASKEDIYQNLNDTG